MEISVTTKPPRTIREVYDALPEGTLAQLIQSQLVMSPAPTYGHQKLVVRLCTMINNFLNQYDMGEVLVAPYDVHLDDENVFQPDILYLRKDQFSNIRKDGFHGAPSLVIELLSPGTARYDQHQKKTVYERHGVQEYWIVNPDSKDVKGYFLEEGRYGKAIQLTSSITSRLLGEDFHFLT